MAVRDWAWWQVPLLLRSYVAVIIGLDVAVIAFAVVHTDWQLLDVVKFVVLVCCGTISIASTPRIMYSYPGVTRDFSSIWVLPTAILLPPIYAALIPIPIVATLQIFVHPGLVYRRVFTAAATSLGYAAASLIFRLLPHYLSGGGIGVGAHAFTWAIAVAACEIIGGRAHHLLILFAVKLASPQVRIWQLERDRESLQGLFVEIDLGVLITVAFGLSPLLVILALPTVLLVRRFLIFPVLQAQSRTDAKTGLLNVSTWESEAETEISRTIRTRTAIALCLVDIDHFKVVNDTYGHLVGDRVLKAIADALTSQSRDYDRAGRFGGEEFVLLLAQTGEEDAKKIAQRLRGYVEGLTIPVDDRLDAPTIQVTISVGVTALGRGESHELTDLLAAADSAMYHAKQAGRNRVAYAPPARDMGLNAALESASPTADSPAHRSSRAGDAVGAGVQLPTPLSSHHVVLVQADPAAASLCP
jgi:diguanylate cyclase (GGDEF)-like protein